MSGIGGSYIIGANGERTLVFRTDDPRAEISNEQNPLKNKKAVKNGEAGTKQGASRKDRDDLRD